MRTALLSILVGTALGCTTEPGACISDSACAEGGICVNSRCIGAKVEGGFAALYAEEFRLRLDVDCGICHVVTDEGGIAPNDGSWDLFSAGQLDLKRTRQNYDDLLEFVGVGEPSDMDLVAYALGTRVITDGMGGRPCLNARNEAKECHPIIYTDKEAVHYKRLLNWLALAPEPPPPDVPDGETVGGLEGYEAAIHPVLIQGCGCHVGGGRPWTIFADPARMSESFEATKVWINAARPDDSKLLLFAAGLDGHAKKWVPGSAQYTLVRGWISRTL